MFSCSFYDILSIGGGMDMFDAIVFTQNELNCAIDKGVTRILLCGGNFNLPDNIDITYTSVGADTALLIAAPTSFASSYRSFWGSYRTSYRLSASFTSSFSSSFGTSFKLTSFLGSFRRRVYDRILKEISVNGYGIHLI